MKPRNNAARSCAREELELSGSPRRRVSPGPPTGQALLVAGATLRISPEPLRNNAICERLACPTERLRGESETTAVYRFTSGTDEATPLAATRENSSRPPCAFWKLPGPGRPPAPRPRREPISAPAPRIVCPPPSTPALHAGHAACDAVDGSETSVLLVPRSTAYVSTVLLKSKSINRFFHLGCALVFTTALHGRAGESSGFALRRRGLFGLV